VWQGQAGSGTSIGIPRSVPIETSIETSIGTTAQLGSAALAAALRAAGLLVGSDQALSDPGDDRDGDGIADHAVAGGVGDRPVVGVNGSPVIGEALEAFAFAGGEPTHRHQPQRTDRAKVWVAVTAAVAAVTGVTAAGAAVGALGLGRAVVGEGMEDHGAVVGGSVGAFAAAGSERASKAGSRSSAVLSVGGEVGTRAGAGGDC